MNTNEAMVAIVDKLVTRVTDEATRAGRSNANADAAYNSAREAHKARETAENRLAIAMKIMTLRQRARYETAVEKAEDIPF